MKALGALAYLIVHVVAAAAVGGFTARLAIEAAKIGWGVVG